MDMDDSPTTATNPYHTNHTPASSRPTAAAPKRPTIIPHSRARELPPGNEEASADLKLGEFEGVPTLTLSEGRLLLKRFLEFRQQEKDGPKLEGEILNKTMDYLDVFARFRSQDVVETVERLLKGHQLKGEVVDFERAQLGSLCCETAEEAKSLIPSIGDKMSDSTLQEVLDELTKLRTFVE